MRATPHIAVVGAGIAGLACATTLQQAGVQVSVFDKSRGAGGRMSTRRTDSWQCDHGAQGSLMNKWTYAGVGLSADQGARRAVVSFTTSGLEGVNNFV